MSAIEPKLLSQLLQPQMMNASPLLSSSSSAPESSGNEFADLLQLLLAQNGTNTNTVNSRPALMPALTPYINELNDDVNAGTWLRGASNYADFIQSASRRFGVDIHLIQAVAAAESSFNPNAVSPAGAKGLMQLMDATGAAMGVSDPFDPEQNILGGARYLSRLLMKYGGNEMTALAAYNAGPSRVDKLGITNDTELLKKLGELPQETQRYIQKVLRFKDKLNV